MIDSRCGLHCTGCEWKESQGCGGCIETNGNPLIRNTVTNLPGRESSSARNGRNCIPENNYRNEKVNSLLLAISTVHGMLSWVRLQ